MHRRLRPAWGHLPNPGTSWLLRAACGVLVMATLAMGSPALAEGEEAPVTTGVDDVPAEPTEIPPPTDIPPPPTDIPPPPTDVPPPPTDIPPPEPPATDIPTATDVPPTDTPTETPSPTPTETPTPTPTPTLAYALADQPDCTLVPGQESSIASGGALEYRCIDTVTYTGTGIVPANVTARWTVSAAIAGGWSVQLLRPQNGPDDVPEWASPDLAETHFDFDQLQTAGTGTEATDLNTPARIEFRVRVTRTACALEPQAVQLRHDIVVQSPEATAEAEPSVREPLGLTPDLRAVPDPSVAIDGALNFGEIGVTAEGPTEPVRTGTLAVVVSDLDQACGEWTLHVSATALADQDGAPLDGARLVVTTIDGEALPDGGCDLAEGCDLAALAGNPGGDAVRSISLRVELRIPEQPSPGAFSTSFAAALLPAAAT